MPESTSTYKLTLEGDGSGLNAVLAAFKRNITSTVTDIERTTNNLKLFTTLDADLKKSAQAVDQTRASVSSLTRTIETLRDAGEPVGKDLEKGLATAQRAAAAAEREFVKQSQAVDKLRTSLRTAGVDVTNLAAAEQKLAVQTRAAAAAEQQRQAAGVLGIKLDRDRQSELAQLGAAFNTLKTSGTASYNDIAQAASAYRARAAEVMSGTDSLATKFQAMRGAVLGVTAGIAAGVAVFRELAGIAIDAERTIAQFGARTNLSEVQVKALTDGVRELAQVTGFDLAQGLEAARALLAAGVPAGNVLEVLATADDAAKAAVTELGVAADLAGTLIRGFGVNAGSVKDELDKLLVVARSGGPAFSDLANGLGSIAPLARATNTSLGDVAAILLVLTQSGLPAGEAMTTVTQILTRLGSAEVRRGLRELGIEATGALDILTALGERGLPLEQILGLELSSRRAAAGIAALTSDSERLTAALQTVGDATGSIDTVATSLNSIRAEALERLVASLTVLKTELGEIVTPTAQTIQHLTELVRLLNNITAAINSARNSGSSFVAMFMNAAEVAKDQILPSLGSVTAYYKLVGTAAKAANELIAESSAAARDAVLNASEAQEAAANTSVELAEKSKAAFTAIKNDLNAAIKDLQEAARGLSTLMTEEIASINTRLSERLAQLDKLRASELENIQDAIEFERKAAAERLAVLRQSATEIMAVVDQMVEARRAAGKAQEENEKKTEAAIAQIKKDALTKIIAGFQAHVDRLLQIERGHLDKIRDLEQQRTQISQSVEDRIRNIRLQGLDDYQKYNATLREIDKLTSLAREALAVGDLKAAENYAQKSIELASGISQQVTKDGEVVVTQFDAQRVAIDKIKQGESLLLEANERRTQAEIEGARATKQNLDSAASQLDQLKGQLEGLNATIKEGIDLEVRTDSDSVDEARRKIDELNNRNTSSTHTVKVVVENDTGIPIDTGSSSSGFARGGLVGGETGRRATAFGQFVSRMRAGGGHSSLPGALTQFFAAGGPTSPEEAIEFNRSLERLYSNLLELIAAGDTIPKAPWDQGTNVADWAREVLRKFWEYGAGRQKQIRDFVNSNFDDWMIAIEEGRRTRSPVLVDQRAKALAFHGGGVVGALQHFARGGQVFRKPSWAKVPGSGDQDTVPALLRAGSFVMRKSASRYYGDDLMARLARGFAVGGSVSDILIGKNTKGVQLGGVVNEFRETLDKIFQLQEAARGLPRSSTGLNIGDWASRVIERFPLFDAKRRDKIKSVVEDGFEGWLASIESARRYRVPVVMELGVGALAFRKGGHLADIGQALARLQAFARGGSARGADTVPAMLTPGEWVIKSDAVRRYGAGLMQAINSMMIPRETLAGMLAPPVPRYLAEGGPVGASLEFASGTAAPVGREKERAQMVVNVNFHVDGRDLLDEGQIRKKIIPAINDAMRRTSQRLVET